MELKVRVVCLPDAAAGFALAGLLPVVVEDEAEAAAALHAAVADPGAGVVLVDERLHGALPAPARRRFDRQALPIVAPFPAPSWDARGIAEGHVLEILRQAIGYRVRSR